MSAGGYRPTLEPAPAGLPRGRVESFVAGRDRARWLSPGGHLQAQVPAVGGLAWVSLGDRGGRLVTVQVVIPPGGHGAALLDLAERYDAIASVCADFPEIVPGDAMVDVLVWLANRAHETSIAPCPCDGAPLDPARLSERTRRHVERTQERGATPPLGRVTPDRT